MYKRQHLGWTTVKNENQEFSASVPLQCAMYFPSLEAGIAGTGCEYNGKLMSWMLYNALFTTGMFVKFRLANVAGLAIVTKLFRKRL